MANTRAQTLANAREFSRRRRHKRYGMCLQWSREMAGIGAKYPDAITSAKHAPRKMGTPPPGTFVYWKNLGRGRYGHIAISAGGGYVYSTDFKVRNRVDKVSINSISRGWNMGYIGWSDECNDVQLRDEPKPKPAPKPAAKPEPLKNFRLSTFRGSVKVVGYNRGYPSHVAVCQTALQALGYNPGPVTGIKDKRTIGAMNRFLKDWKWPRATGRILRFDQLDRLIWEAEKLHPGTGYPPRAEK